MFQIEKHLTDPYPKTINVKATQHRGLGCALELAPEFKWTPPPQIFDFGQVI